MLIGGWAGVGALSAAIASLVMCQDQWGNGVILFFVALSVGEAAVLWVIGLREVPLLWLWISPVVGVVASYSIGSAYFTLGLLLSVIMVGGAVFGAPDAARVSAPLVVAMFYGAAVVTAPVALALSAMQSAILTQGKPSLPLPWWLLVAVAGLALGIFVPQLSGGPMLACHPDQLGAGFAFLPTFALPAVSGAAYGALRALALAPSVDFARAAGR